MSNGTTSASSGVPSTTTTTVAGAGGGDGGGGGGGAGQGQMIDENFLQTGRTGRRNALGDILDENKTLATTAGLTETLQALNFGNDANMMPGPSGMSSGGAGGSGTASTTTSTGQ